MKVIQCVASIAPHAAGPSYSVSHLSEALAVCGVDVELHHVGKIARSDGPYPIVSHRKHHYPSWSLARSPEMYRALRDACTTMDIFHVNGMWMMPCVYPACAIQASARRGGRVPKLVTSPRGSLAPWALHKGWMKKHVFGWMYQYKALSLTDMFHATSTKEYEEIRAAGYRQPVAIVPIGMDIPEVESKEKKNQRRVRRVVFFGRLHKVKGVDRLLLAWGQAAREGWELMIAGPDCGMLDTLKGIVAERKLPRVLFVGEINGHAKYEFLAEGDIYVLPSDTENFGITVAEALATGTPVIASRGTPWQGLEREKCGRWVPIGVEPLAMALKELMALHDAEREAMGMRGKDWIRRDFAWTGIGAKMKAAYEWLLAPENVARPEWVRVE